MLSDQTKHNRGINMSHLNYNTKNRKGKHINYEERLKIEALLKVGLKSEEIGRQLGGRSGRTIRREIKRGEVRVLNSDLTTRTEYSADVAQQKHDYNATAKGAGLKMANNYELVDFIEKEIRDEKKSPYAVAEELKQNKDDFKITLCFKTIYNYIDAGYFPTLTNKDLTVKKQGKKRSYHHIRTSIKNSKGTSISERPKEIDERKEYGHWEMDTVVGKQGTKAVLLVLTERMGRGEIISKMSAKTQGCVVKALDKLERKMGSKKFRETFKTITCDNGCENLDFEGIERSCITKTPRTKVYYAHPYSAWERGSNENANKLIRRFIPKGTDIGKILPPKIKMIENWINNYPRRILGGLSSNKMYNLLKIDT